MTLATEAAALARPMDIALGDGQVNSTKNSETTYNIR